MSNIQQNVQRKQSQHDNSNNIPNQKAISALMVKELNEMSAQEREMIYDEIHGIARVVNEEPEFVHKCLYEMQLSLNKIRNKPAYDIAYSQCPEYATSKDLFLVFLRSTCFDPKESATKIVKYFEHKRLCFGDEFLCRPIRYSDLGELGVQCLRNGWVQALPFRDKAGRLVVFTMFQFFNPNLEPLDVVSLFQTSIIQIYIHDIYIYSCFLLLSLLSYSPSNMYEILSLFVNTKKTNTYINVRYQVRCLFCSTMALISDEENQKRGFVDVVTGIETLEMTPKIRETIWYIAEQQNAMPFRMVANHFCIEKESMALQLVSLANNTWGKDNRARNRIHKGTQIEWMYKLMTFGIPVEYAPITNGGQVKSKFFRDWYAATKLLETNYPNSKKDNVHAAYPPYDKIVIFPRQTDVLSGKGSLAQQYSGNLLFNQLLEGYQSQYQEESERKKKWQITKLVWELLQKDNVRFLERHANGYVWEVIHDENEIFKRINYRLRMKQKSKSPKKPLEQNNNQHDLESTNEASISFLNQSGQLNCSFDCCHPLNEAKRRKV